MEPDAVDAHRFERLAAAGTAALRAGDPERAAATLRDALALWRGPALADLTGQRFAAAAAALTELRLTALVDRAEAELALGRGAASSRSSRPRPPSTRCNERLAARHIAALYATGRQADALDAYERVRARLADELGAAPSPDLQAAHLAVLEGDAPRRAAVAAQQPARAGDELRRPRTGDRAHRRAARTSRAWSPSSAPAAPARRGSPARRSRAGSTASPTACGWSSWRR